MKTIETKTTRNSWLKTLYKEGVLVANEETRNLADKLYAYRKCYEFLGESLNRFMPKTIGLQEFIKRYDLLEDNCKLKNIDTIKLALETEFPCGYIIKPNAVINTSGQTDGFYFFRKKIIEELNCPQSYLYQKAVTKVPYFSELLNSIVSGEELIIQENIATSFGHEERSAQEYGEIRVHTFEDRVLFYAGFSRWKVNPVKEDRVFDEVNAFVQEFLNFLPKDYLVGHAWALDILVVGDKFKIIEINTNRGKTGQWSGYLSRPVLLGAYTRHIEQFKDIRFKGISGFLLRKNKGNYFKYLKKYYIEGIH